MILFSYYLKPSALILAPLFLLIATHCLANDSATSLPHGHFPPGVITCPSPDALHKNERTKMWVANGGWRSYDPSFADQVTQFKGAQWEGVQVGNIYCVYSSSNEMTFKITLQYNRLVLDPSQNKWGKNLGGYKNCKANDPSDCPFKPRPVKQGSDIYQQAEKLQSTTNNELAF